MTAPERSMIYHIVDLHIDLIICDRQHSHKAYDHHIIWDQRSHQEGYKRTLNQKRGFLVPKTPFSILLKVSTSNTFIRHSQLMGDG